MEQTNIKIDLASSGLECLKKVAQTKYDLILMDHMMPQMDRIETLKHIRSDENGLNYNVPVIMLTANAMLGARDDYIKEGFVDYLAKPIRGVRLERAIVKYLPAEKVIALDADIQAPVASSQNKEDLTLKKLTELLPEIDVKSGIDYCTGDEEFYKTMLSEFVKAGREANLEKFYKENDWERYRIEAHSLKSNARMIGLNGLADEALGLECAAKNNDIDYINSNHLQVVEHCRIVTGIFKKLNRA